LETCGGDLPKNRKNKSEQSRQLCSVVQNFRGPSQLIPALFPVSPLGYLPCRGVPTSQRGRPPRREVFCVAAGLVSPSWGSLCCRCVGLIIPRFPMSLLGCRCWVVRAVLMFPGLVLVLGWPHCRVVYQVAVAS